MLTLSLSFLQDEEDELEVALAVSLQEVQQQTVIPESRSQGQRDSLPQRGSTQPTSVPQPQGASYAQLTAAAGMNKRQNTNSPQTEPRGRSPTQTKRDIQPQKDTHTDKDPKGTNNTRQNLCVSNVPTSPPSKSDSTKDDNQVVEEGYADQSERPKRSKNRRQRRKGCGQQVVGLSCSPSAPPPVLLWYRRDLRLCDNPALIGSLEVGAPVIPVFIWSPEEEEGPGVTVAMGGACKFIESH